MINPYTPTVKHNVRHFALHVSFGIQSQHATEQKKLL